MFKPMEMPKGMTVPTRDWIQEVFWHHTWGMYSGVIVHGIYPPSEGE
jgi:hypothetical protein